MSELFLGPGQRIEVIAIGACPWGIRDSDDPFQNEA